MQGDLPLERLGENIVRYLAQYLDAQVGAVFIVQGDAFQRFGAYALPFDGAALLRSGDGLAGQAVKNGEPLRVHDVPANYLPIASATGAAQPVELLIVPHRSTAGHTAWWNSDFSARSTQRSPNFCSGSHSRSPPRSAHRWIGRVWRSCCRRPRCRRRNCRHGRGAARKQRGTRGTVPALRESRAQLESQQAELEQINAQLEEQAQALEHQKDALQQSHAILTAKSAELQSANEYKSEFLANMSHELRTPLNSTLILAKLLADNKEGNLNETQVKYAQTISSAGKDLLTLINDVLDLSRIEAGKIDVSPEAVSLASVTDSLVKLFHPQAQEKRLQFAATVEPGTPDEIRTDPQSSARS